MARAAAGFRSLSLLAVLGVLGGVLAIVPVPASAVPSADASAIAFTVTSGGVSQVWTMAIDGTDPAEIAWQPTDNSITDPEDNSNTDLAVSPDGTKVAFTSTPSGGTSDIWVMGFDGSDLTQITWDTGNDSSPAWSADGNTIAFQSDRTGNWDIWLMTTDGATQTRLTKTKSNDTQPAWFPSTRRIAFVSNRSGQADIWAENANRTNLERVTTSTAPDSQPTVNAGGMLIAFTSRRANNTDIYTVPVGGGTNTRVTTPAAIDNEPAFSNDGRFLTFTSTRSGSPQIWRVPRPSGTPVQLTNGVDPAGGSEWIPYAYPTPAWASRDPGTPVRSKFPFAVAQSPDGSKVFVTGTLVSPEGYGVGGFLIAYGASGTLWTATFDGRSGHAASYAVAVSPDGSKVYVAGWMNDSAHVAEFSTQNGGFLAQNNTVFGPAFASAYGITVSPDGSKVFVSATDYTAAGLPREAVTYALDTSMTILWHTTFTKGDPFESQIAVSPDGSSLYWAGDHYGTPVTDARQNDYLTVKYRTSDGALMWSETYNNDAVNGEDDAYGLALSPDGSMAYVNGESGGGPATKYDQATVAYVTSTGTQQWVSRFDSPNHGTDAGAGVAVSPDGTTIYTAGDRSRAVGSKITRDLEATSMDATDGSLNWYAFYNGPGDYTGAGYGDAGFSVNVAPDGNTVYVSGTTYRTGTSFDLTAVGYDTSGNQVWLGRYDGPSHGEEDLGLGLLSPDGSRLYVVGPSKGTYWDATTVAWDLGSCPCQPIAGGAGGASIRAPRSAAPAGFQSTVHRLLRSYLSRSLHPVRRL